MWLIHFCSCRMTPINRGNCWATCQLAGRYFPYLTRYPSSGRHSHCGNASDSTDNCVGVPASKRVAPCRCNSFPTGMILVVWPRPQSRGASNIRCEGFTHKDTKKKKRLSGRTASNSGVSSSRFGQCPGRENWAYSLGHYRSRGHSLQVPLSVHR